MVLTRSELMAEFLDELFKTHPHGLHRQEAVRLAADRGIPERALQRAAREYGVVRIRQGRHLSIWRPPVEEPT